MQRFFTFSRSMRRPAIYLSLFAFLVLAYIITQQNWHNEYEMERTYELETQVGKRTVLTFHARCGGYEHALVNRGKLSCLHLAREEFIAQYAMPWGPPMGYDKFVFEARRPGNDTIDIIGCVMCREELKKSLADQKISRSRFIVHVRE